MLRVHCVVPEIQSGNKTTTPYLLVAGNPATHHHPRTTGEALVCDLSRATAVIAKGKRPVPFRTRKLSPSAPMVLHWERCGRVGRRRTNIPQKSPTPNRVGLFCMPQTMKERLPGQAYVRRVSGGGQTARASERAKRRWSSVHHCTSSKPAAVSSASTPSRRNLAEISV